jgi:hypothetical protein
MLIHRSSRHSFSDLGSLNQDRDGDPIAPNASKWPAFPTVIKGAAAVLAAGLFSYHIVSIDLLRLPGSLFLFQCGHCTPTPTIELATRLGSCMDGARDARGI